MVRQCQLLRLCRSAMYYRSRPVRMLMRCMGIETVYRKPRTSLPAASAQMYPYLLSGLAIARPDQIWAADITCVPMAHGFMSWWCLDLASRRVLAWRLSNTLTTDFCVEALQQALAWCGVPEIVNTDQGAQFTGAAWTSVLSAAGVQISMDGKRRWIDNVFVERL